MDLFDKLKAEPSVQKISREKKTDFESPDPSSETSSPKSSVKTTKDKSRSLSPTKSDSTSSKQVRVVLERSKVTPTPAFQEQASKTAKNLTPTKAQIKQFDPAVLLKAENLQKIHIRKCYVRLKRFNMYNLKESKNTRVKSPPKNLKASKTQSPITKKSSPKRGQRISREVSESLSPPANNSSPKRTPTPTSKGTEQSSPPSKKAKLNAKNSTQFHVKLTSPSRKPSFSIRKEHNEWPKGKKVENKKNLSVTPTKFSRSKLIDQFGKRYFSAIVRVERCQHPTMVAFDSDARELLGRSKRNKSKNLSVSFHSQVEIYDISSKKRGNKKIMKKKDQKSPEPAPLPLLPARLQKIENGMVVNDIELDQSMFFNSSTANLAASTPLTVKRSQTLPLNDDDKGKRPFVQIDDNDDDVEFIVPEINISEKMLTSLSKPTTSSNKSSVEKHKEQNEKPGISPKKPLTKPLPTKGTPQKNTPTKSALLKGTPTVSPSTRAAQSKTSPKKGTSNTKQAQTLSTPTKSITKSTDAVSKTTPLKVSNKLSENMKETTGEEELNSSHSNSSETPNIQKQSAEESSIKTNEAVLEVLSETKKIEPSDDIVSSELQINENSTSKLKLRGESEEPEDREEIKSNRDTNHFLKSNTLSDEIVLSDNANTSGESFASALTETGTFDEKENKTTFEVSHRTRVETETISESSNASTDVQLASSEASNTTMPKSIEVKSSPKLSQQSNSSSNLDSMQDVSLKAIVMEELKFDETNEDQEFQNKLVATPSERYTPNEIEKNKSESPECVGISTKSPFHSNFAAKLAQIDGSSSVASIMDLPINLLGEDTESSSDVHRKVENLIADLMEDNDK